MTLHLLRNLNHHINLLNFRLARIKPPHQVRDPRGSLTARRALSAGFVLVEFRVARDAFDEIGGFVEDEDGGGAETGFVVDEGFVVHEDLAAKEHKEGSEKDTLVNDNATLADATLPFETHISSLLSGEHRHRRPSRNNRQQIIPTTPHTTRMLFNQLAQRNRHLFLDHTPLVNVPTNSKELGTPVTLTTKRGKPVGAPAHDGRGRSDGFDVVDGSRAAKKTDIGGEGGLHAGFAGFAFEGFDERGFFAADIGARARVEDDVKVVSGAAGVFADETVLVGFVDGLLEVGGFVVEFTADVDVGGVGLHGESGNQATFDQLVGFEAQDFAVFAGLRLAFIGVDDEVTRATIQRLVHEGPLETRRETGATTTTHARVFHLIDDPVSAFAEDFLGLVPVAALHGALDSKVVAAVNVGKDAVFIREAYKASERAPASEGRQA